MSPRRLLGGVDWLVSRPLVAAIHVYQWTISPLIGPACRFEPSCSRYMVDAVNRYGVVRGTARGIRRLLRCHPWNPGGYDPP